MKKYTAAELASFRSREIEKMLGALSVKGGLRAKQVPTPDAQALVFAVSDGNYMAELDYLSWEFSTVSRRLFGHYFERWIETGRPGSDRYTMERAYLSLYRRDEDGEQTYIAALHVDPQDSTELRAVKQSPHVHIEDAPDPVPSMHLALEFERGHVVCQDRKSLTAAFTRAVKLVAREIVTRY